jgi:hypothetical protein
MSMSYSRLDSAFVPEPSADGRRSSSVELADETEQLALLALHERL